MRVAVIMAGGSGERFWPLSRRMRPKQLLRLTTPNETMLEEAVNRIAPLVGKYNVFIATTPHLSTPIREAALVPNENVLAEPDKRNTLGCLTWVTASLRARYGEEVTTIVLTADHKIDDPEAFRADVLGGAELAEQEHALVTLGINPDRPETGFGYIECVEKGTKTTAVVKFREKPDLKTAEEFLETGRFVWNSGMFIWTLGAFMDQLEIALKEAADVTTEMANAIEKNDLDAASEAFRKLPNLSIDYALMEKAPKVMCVRADFPWDDVGSLDALLRTMPTDENGNMILGAVEALNCKNSVLYNDAPDGVLTAVGLENMLMVRTADATLCAPLSDAQRVKEIVQKLAGTTYL